MILLKKHLNNKNDDFSDDLIKNYEKIATLNQNEFLQYFSFSSSGLSRKRNKQQPI